MQQNPRDIALLSDASTTWPKIILKSAQVVETSVNVISNILSNIFSGLHPPEGS